VVEGQLRLADGARVRDVSQEAADRQPAEASASPAPPKQPARQDSAR